MPKKPENILVMTPKMSRITSVKTVFAIKLTSIEEAYTDFPVGASITKQFGVVLL